MAKDTEPQVPTEGTPESGATPGAATEPAAAPAEPEVVAEPEVTEVLDYTYANWGPAEPDPDKVISFHQLQLAEFHGDTPEPTSQEHLARFEDFLRSHNIGGTNRNSEGHYGDKTRELVDTAYEKLLGKPGNGVIGEDLMEALRRLGADVSG